MTKRIELEAGYFIKITRKKTGSNYNVFATIFKHTEKLPVAGTSFHERTWNDTSEILEYGNKWVNRLNSYHPATESELMLNQLRMFSKNKLSV